MGVLSDVFLANDDELKKAFLGWKPPREVPVLRANPFDPTRTVKDWGPGPDEKFDRNAAMQGNLKGLARADLKGLDPTHIEMLSEVLDVALTLEDTSRLAVYGPPGSEEIVMQVPPALVERLARLSSAALSAAAKRWAELIAEDLETSEHSEVSWLKYLKTMRAFAEQAQGDKQNMYLWMCP